MALYATNRFPGDGTTTSYEFNFVGKYITRAHVKAYQEDNVTKARTPVVLTDANFLNDTTLYGIPATPLGSTFVVYRDTPKEPLVDFTNGARFTEHNLDLVARQGVFIAQEAVDATGADEHMLLVAAVEAAQQVLAMAQAAADDAALSADSAETHRVGAELAAAAALAEKVAAQLAQAAAEEAARQATAAAGAIGPLMFFDTFAQASVYAAGAPSDVLVEVFKDETKSNSRTRYRTAGGNLVFAVDLDQLRVDLANPATGLAALGAFIATNRTLHVPGDFPSIQACMTYLSGRVIAPGVTVTIKVADGVHILTGPVVMNHPQGKQIRLVGNEVTPAACVLTTPSMPTWSAIVCINGNTLGYLNGFTITTPTKLPLSHNHTGVLADFGSVIVCGPAVHVDNWYYGFAARHSSTIFADGCRVANAGDVGFWAVYGSSLQARSASAINAADPANGYGFGFQAEYGSSLDIQGSTASGCAVAGIASLSSSSVRAPNTSANSNKHGFLARDGGDLWLEGSTASSNTDYGAYVFDAGTISGALSGTGNGAALRNPYAALTNTADLGARLVSTSSLRIDAASPIYFNTNGLQFEVGSEASTGNRLEVVGGTASYANQPSVRAKGNDANISVRYVAKGMGGHYFAGQGGTQFGVGGSGPSYLEAVSGSVPNLQACGASPVIDLAILPKGAGSYVQLGTGWVSSPDVACNGFVYIKDSAGVVRKLMTTA